MTERFLKTSNEFPIDIATMPTKDSVKREIALWLCRNNGPALGECLQVGMAILRSQDLEKLSDDEHPPFWAFVGFLEWIKTGAPEQCAVDRVLGDLRQMIPASKQTLQRVLERIGEKRPEFKLVSIRVSLLLR